MTEAVASVFSTVNEMDGFQVHAVFHAEDLPGYAAYTAQDCPFCKKGIKLAEQTISTQPENNSIMKSGD